jgi:2-succinyl-6-hydroxy-2,4-cyclohexadiene-1-carboxylate synthase
VSFPAGIMWRVRRTVVLLHGFTHTGRSWDPVVARLGERYRALAPDIRGHGAAAGLRPIGPAECAADVVAAAPERFVLAGYSMGGRVALHVALSQPGRVEALALVGATPGLADPVEREAREREDAALAEKVEGWTIEEFADRWGRNPLFKGQPAEVADAAHADRLRNEPAGLAAALRGLGQGACEPLWGRLGELRMPVVLIVGERDAKYRKLAERMAAAIPHADLLVVPATGHAVHLEAPAIVAEAIAQAASAREPAC